MPVGIYERTEIHRDALRKAATGNKHAYKQVPSHSAIHNWLKTYYTKPSICENCGRDGQKIWWSNISGEYTRNISDWAALCTQCHALINNNGRVRPKYEASMIGKKLGRLTILKYHHSPSFWLFRCDCGTEKVIRLAHVNSGKTKSCGCYNKDIARSTKLSHGETNANLTLEYKAWSGMLRRCRARSGKDYKNYMLRGITVCDRWQGANGYRNFLNDMGRKLSPEYSLDRIDNNKGYLPANCRWATRSQQASNTRKNHYLTYKGETQTVSAWAKELNIYRKTITYRIDHMGMSVEEAFTVPINNQRGRKKD